MTEQEYQVLYLWFDGTQTTYSTFVTDKGSYIRATAVSSIPNTEKFKKGSYSDDFYIGRHNCKKIEMGKN